jgi:hypothetical protein
MKSARLSAPSWRLEAGLAASEMRQSFCAFSFYERLERFADHARFVPKTREGLCFLHELVVESKSGSHTLILRQ